MQPLSFQDLANNQLCTFIHTQDFGIQDICMGVRRENHLLFIYSMTGETPTHDCAIDGEYLRRNCTFIKAGDIFYIDPQDYPEICI